MKKMICFAIVLCTIAYSHAQTLTGVVQTKKGSHIESATVNILNTDRITIADKEGSFTFTNLSVGTYQLSISSVGFASQIKAVKVTEGNTNVTVVLEEAGKQLDEVVVSSDKIETKLQQTPAAVSS